MPGNERQPKSTERPKTQEHVVTTTLAEPGHLLLAAFPAILRAARRRGRAGRRGTVSMPPRYAPARTVVIALSVALALAIFGSVRRQSAPARGCLDILRARAQARYESRVRSAATVVAVHTTTAAAADAPTVAVESASSTRHGNSRYRAAQGR